MSRNLNDILDVAIKDEIKAQEFYQGLHNKTANARLKEFFNSLIREEAGHERILKGVKEMQLYDGDIAVDEESLRRIEGAHHIPDEQTLDEMTIEKAMEIAMKRENKAAQVYAQMAETSPQAEIMKLFTSIASDERRHFESIERHYKMHTGQMGWEA